MRGGVELTEARRRGGSAVLLTAHSGVRTRLLSSASRLGISNDCGRGCPRIGGAHCSPALVGGLWEGKEVSVGLGELVNAAADHLEYCLSLCGG